MRTGQPHDRDKLTYRQSSGARDRGPGPAQALRLDRGAARHRPRDSPWDHVRPGRRQRRRQVDAGEVALRSAQTRRGHDPRRSVGGERADAAAGAAARRHDDLPGPEPRADARAPRQRRARPRSDPRRRVSRAASAACGRDALPGARRPRPAGGDAGRGALAGRAAAAGDREGALPALPARDHGRADRRAGRRGVRAALPRHRRPASGRRLGPLHLPSPRRGAEALQRRRRDARRCEGPRPADRRADRVRPGARDDRPRGSPAGGDRRRARRGRARRRRARPGDAAETSASSCTRERCSASPASSAPAARV